jgi:hypothetical protein
VLLRKEAFAAAQLAQRSNTVRFVQQASARIGAAARDARVAEAVRKLQDADQVLRALFAERDAGMAGLDVRIAAAQQARAEAESVVAAAAPGYRQLLLSSVDADAVATACCSAALRGAQLLLLDEAGKRLPEEFGPPFYWAPFGLIGGGRRSAQVQSAAARSTPRM